MDSIRELSLKEREVGSISDLAVTECPCRRGRGNKYIMDKQNGARLQRPYSPGKGVSFNFLDLL